MVPLVLTLLASPLAAAPDEPPNLADAARVAAAELSSADTTAVRSDLRLDDGRRTVSKFVPNLGRNLVGVFSGQNLRPLISGTFLTAAATAFDDSTSRTFRGKASDFGQIGGQAGTLSTVAPLALGLFAAGRATSDVAIRATTYDIAQATIVTALYTSALKAAVGRPRPDGSDERSFPSGHTSNAFAWAAVASQHYGPKVGIPAYAAAGLIGLSRIESDKHHLSDVLAGATLGIVVGKTVVRRDGAPSGRSRSLSLVPMTDAAGGGVGAGIHVAF